MFKDIKKILIFLIAMLITPLFAVTKYLPSTLVIEPEGYTYQQKLYVNSQYVIQAFLDSKIGVNPNYDEKMRLKGFITVRPRSFYFNLFLHSPNATFSDVVLKSDVITYNSLKGNGNEYMLVHIGGDIGLYSQLENYYNTGNHDVYLYWGNINMETPFTKQPPDWDYAPSYTVSIASSDLNLYNQEEDEFIYILYVEDIEEITFTNYDRIVNIEQADMPATFNCNDIRCLFVITNVGYVEAGLTSQIARLLASLGFVEPIYVYEVYTGQYGYLEVTLSDNLGVSSDKDGIFWGGMWVFPPTGLTFFDNSKVDVITVEDDYTTYSVRQEFYDKGFTVNCWASDNGEFISTTGSTCVAIKDYGDDKIKLYSNFENPESYTSTLDFYSLGLYTLEPINKLASFFYIVSFQLYDYRSLPVPGYTSHINIQFFTPYVIVNSEPDIYGHITKFPHT